MALTTIHLNQISNNNVNVQKEQGTEWLQHARTVTIALIVGLALFLTIPFLAHAVNVPPTTNAQLTSAVITHTTNNNFPPVVISTTNTGHHKGLLAMGTLNP